jgi:hypothetical protein
MVQVEKKRNITQNQRYLERQIRLYRTKLELSVDEQEKKMYHKQVIELARDYKKFCSDNNVPRYDWRTKIN